MQSFNDLDPGLGLALISKSKATLQERFKNLDQSTLDRIVQSLNDLEIAGLFDEKIEIGEPETLIDVQREETEILNDQQDVEMRDLRHIDVKYTPARGAGIREPSLIVYCDQDFKSYGVLDAYRSPVKTNSKQYTQLTWSNL